MSRFEPLKYLEAKIQDRVNALQITEVAQHFNNPNLEIEMCEALLAIFNIVKNFEEARWARTPIIKSNKNLSWIVSSKINPILSKTKDIGGTSLLDYDFVKFSLSEKSEKNHIQNLAIFFQKQDYFDDSEKSALAFLSETLFILVAHYSPNEKKSKKGDGFYCLYCFRERNLGSDACDMHNGVNRTKGERFYKRYVEMKKAINFYGRGGGFRNLKVFNSIALNELSERKVCLWSAASDKSAWIKEVLTLFEIHDDKWKVQAKTEELLRLSIKDDLSFFRNWPSSLNGTMFRYQAYILAKYRRPTTKMIEKLNQVWGGQKIIDVAKKSNVIRPGLQRAVIDWRKKINRLRSDKVPDELIKVALGLEFLPALKSGGAANKNSPQRF